MLCSGNIVSVGILICFLMKVGAVLLSNHKNTKLPVLDIKVDLTSEHFNCEDIQGLSIGNLSLGFNK